MQTVLAPRRATLFRTHISLLRGFLLSAQALLTVPQARQTQTARADVVRSDLRSPEAAAALPLPINAPSRPRQAVVIQQHTAATAAKTDLLLLIVVRV